MTTALTERKDAAPAAPPPCYQCATYVKGERIHSIPSVVWLDIPALYFRSGVCESCAARLIATADARGAAWELGAVAHVPIVRAVEGLVLADFAREVLDGVTGDETIPAFPNTRDATPIVVRTLAARLRRPLLPSERVGVQRAVYVEVVRRREARTAGLRETASRLRVPGRMAS